MWFALRVPLLAVLGILSLSSFGLAQQPAVVAPSKKTSASPQAIVVIADESVVEHLPGEEPPTQWVESGEVVVPSASCYPISSKLTVDYDDGFLLRPIDKSRTPFELKLNFHNQFRYTGFARDQPGYINAAGDPIPIENRNDFGVNRGRIVFSGFAIDPDLSYYINIDYNTVTGENISILTAWFGYRFSDALRLSFGLGKVPGTWEWLESSRYTLGAERSMATTFFRPSFTAGVWADGRLPGNVRYRAMVGDGFNTRSLSETEIDTSLLFSEMVWWEPLGDFGIGFSDLERHQRPVIRVGEAFTYAPNDAGPFGEPGPEQTVIRLSDGTPIVAEGALAPGVTVNSFNIALCSLHAGLKYRGFSLDGEYFLRWLTQIDGNGALPVSSLFDQGFMAQTGLFVLPKVELYAIGSFVTGDFGSGSQVTGGANWYVRGTRNWRVTFDATALDTSPAQQARTGYQAGATGPLIRAQVWILF
ncbi:porin [Kolteria novifilia]|uniref:porin n=1 Tax=Kolteria novifilia TaxID=2527975 RepID=UPI003AF4065D